MEKLTKYKSSAGKAFLKLFLWLVGGERKGNSISKKSINEIVGLLKLKKIAR